jgi:hypothetical protein
MPPKAPADASASDRVLSALAENGLLLKQDKRLPNVVTIVTGESLSTSWWSHPQGRLIFATLCGMADHRDVLVAKLLHRKDTLVHRELWPAFLAVAAARDPWQLEGLSAPARRLLAAVTASRAPVRCSGTVVKELELRLLVRTEETHTESGRHERVAEPWIRWASRMRVRPLASSADGRERLLRAAARIGAPASALPWR